MGPRLVGTLNRADQLLWLRYDHTETRDGGMRRRSKYKWEEKTEKRQTININVQQNQCDHQIFHQSYNNAIMINNK